MPNFIETTDAAGNSSTGYTLQAGQTAQGTLSGTGDHDWYRVNLTAGQTYSFAMTGTGTSNVQNPYLRLYSVDGTSLLISNDDGLPGQNSVMSYTALTTGTYYLDASAYSAFDTGQYGVSFTAGSRPSFDTQMGAGVIDTDSSWSAAGVPATVTYGFRQSPATYTAGTSNISTFTQLTATEEAAVRATLQLWSSIANINFVEVNPGGYTDSATMLFGNYTDSTDGAGAFAYYPGSTASTSNSGDVWLNTKSISTTATITPGSYSFSAIMHEIGHAIGLSHPGLYNAAAGVSITYANNAQFVQDSRQYSIMSYFSESNTGAQFNGYPDTPMLFDDYAVQQIYGANTTTRVGDTTYGFNCTADSTYDFTQNTNPAYCIWDAGGNDTIDASGYSQNQLINLAAESFSNIGAGTSNISIASNAIIENAVGGSGNDSVYGNAANNTLSGGAGNDTIFAGSGNDVLIAGAGNDVMDGGTGVDTSVYSVASGSAAIAHTRNGTIVISDAVDGVDTLSHVEWAQFTDKRIWIGTAARDFGQDGQSDLLWRKSSGQALIWNSNGSGGFAGQDLGSIDINYQIALTGDFNGDGSADILWRGSAGDLVVWNSNVAGGFTAQGLGTVDNSFKIAATGDFNFDGRADLLWRSTSGQTILWNSNGSGGFSAQNLGTIDTNFQIAGTADFNGDGGADILWRNTNGQVVIWNSNGTGGFVAQNYGLVDTSFQIAGTGDFNADGSADILWRNTNGQTVLWNSNGAGGLAAQNLGIVDTSFQISGTADFNGDGSADILWRSTSGQAVTWNSNGAGGFTSQSLGFVDGSWSLVQGR